MIMGKKVTISVQSLFEKMCVQSGFDPELTDDVATQYGFIEKFHDADNEYFDLKTALGTVAMDGETCEVLGENRDWIELQSEAAAVSFRLTADEFSLCCTPIKDKEEKSPYTIIRDGKTIELTPEEVARLSEEYERAGTRAWLENFVKDQYNEEFANVFIKSGGLYPAAAQIVDDMSEYNANNDERAEAYDETARNAIDVFMQEKVYDLWEEFGDIPMDPETECIESEFLDFPAGTHREEIWHWFEDTFDVPVVDLLYGEGEVERG